MQMPAPADAARHETAVRLQPLLVATLDLVLQVNQARWNTSGPGGHDARLHFAEIARALGELGGAIAERVVKLGEPADGRAEAILGMSPLAPLPSGWLSVEQASAQLARRMDALAKLAREQLSPIARLDSVSHGVVFRLAQIAGKYRWLLRAAA
jgi:starvation-inducible DNA-binding protein